MRRWRLCSMTSSRTPASLLDDLKSQGFPGEVVEAVAALTKARRRVTADAARRASQNPIARQVKLADVEDNMNLSRLSAPTEKDYARLREYEQVKRLLENKTD